MGRAKPAMKRMAKPDRCSCRLCMLAESVFLCEGRHAEVAMKGETACETIQGHTPAAGSLATLGTEAHRHGQGEVTGVAAASWCCISSKPYHGCSRT